MSNDGAHLTALEQAIVKTVAFFDIFNYPLTLVEIHKWLWQPDTEYSLFDISTAVDSMSLQTILGRQSGFYFLAGRENIVSVRLERYILAERKFAIARSAARWMRHVPGVKMIAVCNNAAFSNGSAKSDIDVVIIVQRYRVWLIRLLVTVLTQSIGLRRYGTHITNRVCLSFYISDDHLDMSDVMLTPHDPYFVYWVSTLAPMYGQNMYENFLAANAWQHQILPNSVPALITDRRRVDPLLSTMGQKILGFFVLGWPGRMGEYGAKFFQMLKMSHNVSSSAYEPNTNVVISDQMLKFHEQDRRIQYRSMWQLRLNQFNLKM